MKKLPLTSILIASLVIVPGCSHKLRVTNLSDCFSPVLMPRKNTIRLVVSSSNDAHIQNSRYINAIVEALGRNASVEKMIGALPDNRENVIWYK